MKTLSSYRVLASILLLASALLTATPRAQFPTSLSGANDPTAGEPDVHPMIQNPAAVHCRDLGYRYEVVGDREQRGICTLPDGEACDAWAFLQGKCGQHYSYCAQQGYEVRTVRDGNDPFSPEYAVCVTSEGMVVGSVTELSNLSAKAMGCGGEAPSRGRPSVFEGGGEYVPPVEADVPASFDWRTYQGSDWLTPVKDQGGCGSCWAFSAVGVSEAAHNIANSNPNLDMDLSEQYLVSDCSPGTCCGGWHSTALQYIRDSGIPDEGCLSYVDGVGCSCDGGTCDSNCTYRTGGRCSDRTCSDRCADWSSRLQSIVSTGSVSSDRPTIKQALVDLGPLSVAIGIGSSYGGYWDGDIYRCSIDSGANHAVGIVGYDEAGGYWWIRNSWGTGWGDNGYFKLGYGECYVEQAVYYATAGSSGGDAYEPDDTWDQANWIENGSPQTHSIVPAADVDWVKFSLGAESEVVIETSGPSGDTRMWLYDSSLNQLEYNDDDGPGSFSRIDRLCGVDALAAGTYYVKIDEYGNNDEIPTYTLSFTSAACSNTPPTLTWTGETNYVSDGLHPESGITIDDYVYRIRYADADGDAPSYVRVHIEKGGTDIAGSPFPMSCAAGDYTAGVMCSYTKAGLEEGADYAYYFVASDDQGNPATPTPKLDAPDVTGSPAASVLLVDDDDNAPDVRSFYTTALDSLGVTYDVWDTGHSDNEPDATTLGGYERVVWFTGGAHGGFAGPGSAGEAALASFLDAGTCLFISSQDYFWDRGLTSFMVSYLGVSSASNDVGQTMVTGAGSAFGGLGPYALNYPFTNASDRISPDGTAELAFSGNQGDAAVDKDSGVYRTTFWGFPFEALPSAADRQATMDAFLTWCAGSSLAAPSDLGSVAMSEAHIDLAWMDHSDDESDFRLERSPEGCTAWTEIATVGADVTSYRDAGLSPGTEYCYRVCAHRDGDDQYSAYSNVAKASTVGVVPAPPGTNHAPYPPSNPSPADGATGQSVDVNLSWTGGDPDGDAVTYDVYLVVEDSSTVGPVCQDVAGTTCDPGALSQGTHYEWWVIAVDEHGATTTGPVWDFVTVTGGWTTIKDEDFEGSFPGAWQVSDTDSDNGLYYWGKRTCRPYGGSYSGWAVGGGDGAGLSCGSNYPTYVVGWMVYGPFSLADASDADLTFQLWLNSELSYDGVFRGASINGTNFYGSTTTGNTGGWISRELDLTAVPTLGDLTGQPNVWIALVFISDFSITYSEGAYVDNILLRKYVGTGAGSTGEEMLPLPATAREDVGALSLDR